MMNNNIPSETMDEAMMRKKKREFIHPQPSSPQANADMKEFVSNQTDVSFMLTKHVFFSKEVKGNSNLMFSPLSIQIILGLLAAGSEGPTKDQLLCFLKSKSIDELNSLYSHIVTNVFADGSPSGGPTLSVASGVWIDRSTHFKPSFENIAKKVYKATSKSIDFQNKAVEAVNRVNRWTKKKTNGLIKEILPRGAVDKMTQLILANALYFKGAWNEKFDASETKDHKFHLINGGSVQAPFMTSRKKQYIGVFKGFKVLKLPYKKGTDTPQNFCMYFILPDAHDGLPDLLDKITSKPGFLDHHIPYRKVRVGKFLIPKFKIFFGFEASEVLKGLGLTLPFIDGLNGMVDEDYPLQVSKVFHKSFIEVNEEGTEAAAATVATMMGGCSRMMFKEEKIDFVADHPFLFLVKDETAGAVLFMGTLLNPLVV